MKTPFEKIRSLVERRKFFSELIERKEPIICKDDRDHLFSFMPQEIVGDEQLKGTCRAIDSLPEKSGDVIGNFSLGEEKFFFHGQMQWKGNGEAWIEVECEVFKLQRRTHVRLQLEPELRLHVIITKYKGKATYIEAQASDISAGGVRLHFSGFPIHSHPGLATAHDPGLRTGERFTAVIHPPSGKTIEVICEVKHQLQSAIQGDEIDQYGCEFVELSQLVKNRLIAMSMDLQRKIISGR
jgi:hypothetical protein